jgi:hypothetical protein
MAELWLLDIKGIWIKHDFDTWLKEQSVETNKFDELTERYLYVKRARAKRAAAAAEDDKVFKTEMERLEGVMGDLLTTTGLTNAKSAHGTVYRELEVLPAAEDWTTFYNWISENKAFQFLHKRITAREVAAYMEEHKDDPVSLPPGIRVEKKYVVRVRTATDKTSRFEQEMRDAAKGDE